VNAARILALAITLLAATMPAHAAPVRPEGAVAVAFGTSDGVTLRGWLWGGGKTAVVFSHMFLTDQRIWFELAGRLAAEGYTVLTYDYRGIGRSGGQFVIGRVDRDVLAAVAFVRRGGADSVFLVGASMGGTASLVAAGKTRVSGLVVMASGLQFQGLNVQPYLPTLTAPKLFIVGSRDEPFHSSVKAMYARTPLPKQLLILPSAMHGTDLLKTRHRAAIEDAVFAFLRAYQ
jgi:pimeloyl-ACP methyl ester carboxylesterase